MTRRVITSLLLCVAIPAIAQIGNLSELQQRRSDLTLRCDTLMSQRVRLVARRDSLSTHADSLWRVDPQSTELLRARSASRLLVGRLSGIEQQLDSLETLCDSTDADLRDAYDWEIAQLHRLLNDEGWDEGLYLKLLVFQEERQELGNEIRHSAHHFDAEHELGIAPTDGPDEVRQKIEYAQDRVATLQQQQREIQRQLRLIDRQVLMMKKWQRAEDFMRVHREDIERRMRAEVAPSDRLQPELEAARGFVSPEDSVSTAPREAQWLIESQRLKARAQELGEVEAVLQQRIAVFHEHLARLLAGDFPTATVAEE